MTEQKQRRPLGGVALLVAVLAAVVLAVLLGGCSTVRKMRTPGSVVCSSGGSTAACYRADAQGRLGRAVATFSDGTATFYLGERSSTVHGLTPERFAEIVEAAKGAPSREELRAMGSVTCVGSMDNIVCTPRDEGSK